MSRWWTCGSGTIELLLNGQEIAACSHPGPCDTDVEHAVREHYLAEQLAQLNPDNVRRFLREIGAWDSRELLDHQANLRRLVWIAANDLSEES